MKNIKNLAIAVGLTLALTTTSAVAGDTGAPLPTPGVIGLVAAAVVGAIALVRLRR